MLNSKKGQWYIISAVVVSAILLVISTYFRGYYTIDPSVVALYNEDFIMINIISELNKTIAYSCPDEDKLEENLNRFINFAEEKYRNLGYFVDINITSRIDCTSTSFSIVIKTDRMQITKTISLPS